MKNQNQWRNYLSLIMVLVVGPTMLLLYLALDLKNIIPDQMLRLWLLYIPLAAFFILNATVRLAFNHQQNNCGASNKKGLQEWLEKCALLSICLPVIYISFFLWLGVNK